MNLQLTHLEWNQEYQLFLRMQYFSRLTSSSGEKYMYHNYMYNTAKVPLIENCKF